MIKSYELDLRILLKKYYCPICGERLKIVNDVKKMTEEEKKMYYNQSHMFRYGIPINLDVGKVKQMFNCSKCGYYTTTDNQILVHKKQKILKKKILDKNDLKTLCQ